MRDPRNPFRMRASEHISSDASFLRLFSAGLLELLPEEGLFDKPLFIRSAPGGGKTSLLRSFTPAALRSLHDNQASDDYSDLTLKMRRCGALGRNGPLVLAVLLPCSYSYAELEDLPWEPSSKRRLFFALMNARIVIGILRNTLAVRDLHYPRDLPRISLTLNPEASAELGLDSQASATQLSEWAITIESAIAAALDSLAGTSEQTKGHSNLTSLRLIEPDSITLDGKPLGMRPLIMLDDVHKLSSDQRAILQRLVTADRPPTAIWLAERLEALSIDELLDFGSSLGRDYNEVILEQYWESHPGGFQKLLSNVGDRRVKQSDSADIDSFQGCLAAEITGGDEIEKIDAAIGTIQGRLRSRINPELFDQWSGEITAESTTPFEEIVGWRGLEILVEKQKIKPQLSLGLPLAQEDVEGRRSAAIRQAAEWFVSREFHLPYFYGFKRVAQLASSNIEQFLALSGDLFEESATTQLARRSFQLSPARQNDIVIRAAKTWWEHDLLRSIPYRDEVKSFIENLAETGLADSVRPTIPYGGGGVTGLGVTMEDRDQLRDPAVHRIRRDYGKLAAVIATCLAHNILEVRLNHKQDDDLWMILYLNRLLCPHFGLPIGHGGWRSKHLDQLARWIDPNREMTRLL